jgi:endonuclease-3
MVMSKKHTYAGLTDAERAIAVIKALRTATQGMVEPAATQIIEKYGKNPFLILISCLLSLRARDTASLPASIELFKVARTPQALLALPLKQIEQIIRPVGFYRNKARVLHAVCHTLLERFDGTVPGNREDLLSIKGIGPKTANLVLGLGFDIPALCVDTHVHKISNRLGIIKTKTVEETEAALAALLPNRYWTEYNKLLVMWGQNICVPISPKCSECAIFNLCQRVGVTKRR